jgi:hypothetical protein
MTFDRRRRSCSVVGRGQVDGVELNVPAFVRQVAPFTIIGRIALRQVPFATPINVSGTPAASFQWVGEALPKPSVRLTYTSPAPVLDPLKVAGIWWCPPTSCGSAILAPKACCLPICGMRFAG